MEQKEDACRRKKMLGSGKEKKGMNNNKNPSKKQKVDKNAEMEVQKRYSSMIRMLEGIDREDLEVLWRIVKAKYGESGLTHEFEDVVVWARFKKGIVLGHKVSGVGLEVDKARIDVISKLPPPTNSKALEVFWDMPVSTDVLSKTS
ncbi:hypothetical protein Tco_1109082 [Tanacetum coccineum]